MFTGATEANLSVRTVRSHHRSNENIEPIVAKFEQVKANYETSLLVICAEEQERAIAQRAIRVSPE